MRRILAPPFVPPLARMKAGKYYGAPTNGSYAATAVNGRLEATPLYVPRAVTVDRMLVRVAAAGEAGSVVRLGIYDSDPETGDVTDLILDAGTVPADAAATVSHPCNATLRPGLVWLAAVVQGAATTPPQINKTGFAAMPIGRDAADLNVGQGGYLASSTHQTGALPSTFTGGGFGTYEVNYVMVRVQ